MMDKVLTLNAEQRDKLGEVLTSYWTESWNQTQPLMTGGQYFPPLPESKIAAILTDDQRAIWRGVPKTTVRYGLNMSNLPGVAIPDEVWDDDPPRKKAGDRP